MMAAGFGNAVANTGKRETRWLTPPEITENLGWFDLDPCGAPGQNIARRTYLLENGDDGLRDEWYGRVWLNPPYGKEATPFVQRMVDHANNGGGGTMLVFARTETKMFQDLIWPNASAILFIRGRVRFLREDLTRGESANAPSVLIAFNGYDADMLENCGIPGKFIRL